MLHVAIRKEGWSLCRGRSGTEGSLEFGKKKKRLKACPFKANAEEREKGTPKGKSAFSPEEEGGGDCPFCLDPEKDGTSTDRRKYCSSSWGRVLQRWRP